MKQNRWVSQAVMFGDRRPYPVALLTLDEEELPALAAKLGIEVTAEIGEDPAVREELQAVVDNVNSKFAPVEQVKKFRVLDHDLTMESGDLTPSLKVKRNVVYESYADVFAGMYDDK
jgi:long-chain acyl-CoA synthetase